ncbi:acyl-CoA reductase-like NAD-dependent aldehyde dehydrogenase [Natronocella acetinitrilica]|uniref:Acyl-CoA reductase-like NAD-dependent aldehyde dehydrogenase n=1 Tax=Natronocella acetinitrilica TaxID=414046 RepID=A0AAE3G1L7_9GAMM|nr:aldehyde dehydrogenase [Natronocella acetinitrilica]MCP1673757.1 acyl-CoA reductase-like NAD-dependent aldehyde dehydrogenase [Natronocella acetinitrilica]
MAVPEFKMLVGGERVTADSGQWLDVENPATREIIARVPEGDSADIDAAIAAAHEAQAIWGNTPPQQRAVVLERFAALMRERLDDFVVREVEQIGRAIREMRAQLARLPEWYEYYAAVARTHEGALHPFGGPYINYTQRRPLGVVGLVTPWNHPMLILTKKLAPALAAGNCVVVKPSEVAPITPLMMGDLLEEAGLPAGVYNVVTGYGPTAGKALTEHRGIAKIDVTGGTETGRHIGAAAGRNLVNFAAELGGKASVLVFDDVGAGRAVSGSLFASFIASGQTCVQGARLLVQDTIHDQVVDELVKRVNAIVIGDPMDPATQMGPMVSNRQLDTVKRYVAIGREEGATVAAGGEQLTGGDWDRGYYHQPTVFTDIRPGMRIEQEEIFGPVVCVMPFRDEAHAVELANATDFGLAGSVWTRDVARAHRVARRLDMGIVWINDHHRIDPSSPWGGFKDSGVGKENGIVTYEAYTKTQSVIVNTSDEPFDWFVDDATDKRYS